MNQQHIFYLHSHVNNELLPKYMLPRLETYLGEDGEVRNQILGNDDWSIRLHGLNCLTPSKLRDLADQIDQESKEYLERLGLNE